MKEIALIPREIKVGYDERDDTYTGKLAYVIYVDEKGVLRKETSWEGWRDKSIEPDTYKNEPTSGFVLNKRVGGYGGGWDSRQAYSRIYDPRGFEFEITFENLLYILEYSNCIKGKGLEGEFVYAWAGKDLVLIPVDCPDYEVWKTYTDRVYDFKANKVYAKDLVLGGTYQNKQNEELIYLGRYDKIYYNEEGGKAYFFVNVKNQHDKKELGGKWNMYSSKYTTYSSPTVLIGTVDSTPVSNISDLIEELEHSGYTSLVDDALTTYVDYTQEEIEELNNVQYSIETIYIMHGGEFYNFRLDHNDYHNHDGTFRYNENWYQQIPKFKKDIVGTLNELNKEHRFMKRIEILKNGKEKR